MIAWPSYPRARRTASPVVPSRPAGLRAVLDLWSVHEVARVYPLHVNTCGNDRCAVQYEPKRPDQRYCSRPCRYRAAANRHYSALDPEAREERRIQDAERHRRRSAKVRSQVFAAYGGHCQCCGEMEEAFLQLDHIERDGAAHRREVMGRREGAGYAFYTWLVRNGFPPGLQVLCANCNTAKERPGGCPHQRGIDGIQ